MSKYLWVAATILFLSISAAALNFSTPFFSASAPAPSASSRWGADYFPNVELTTHDGESVRFFDDLIKDKIVVVNFIYTTCADTCPLETAQLVRVQRILGDRLGKDVFFYSITIDPDHDTAAVLSAYRDRFRANWTFLTGDESDITQLRKKLGLYIEEIQDGTNNHNVNMIIGNQATGRWMKRSPFENPHMLAEQLENWLPGWKAPQADREYEDAPLVRNISEGEQLFRTRCAHCHTITGDEPPNALGPDLLGVTQRREMTWLLNWMRAPDQMLANKDPIAMALYEQYDRRTMPNMRLSQQMAEHLIDYMKHETRRLQATNYSSAKNFRTAKPSDVGDAKLTYASAPAGPGQLVEDVVAIMNAWVRESQAESDRNGGYMTLINVGDEDQTLVSVESDSYDTVEVHEMKVVNGMMKMREIEKLVIPANGQVQMKPGGKHLMLIGPREFYRDGESIPLTLTFESGQKQSISVKVVANK